MRYVLRNDDLTVSVEYLPAYRTFLCEVYEGLERLVHYEHETSAGCIAHASNYVEHHVSSIYLWALANDAATEPRVREKSAAYTAECRAKVERLYGRSR